MPQKGIDNKPRKGIDDKPRKGLDDIDDLCTYVDHSSNSPHCESPLSPFNLIQWMNFCIKPWFWGVVL